MSIRDDDLICTCLECTAHCGIDIAGHQFAKTNIFRMSGRNLIPICDASDPFHI